MSPDFRQVVLFGPVSPRKYGPWQNPNARVLYGECGAVERIAVKEVLQAVCGLWGPSIMCPGSRNLGKPR